MVNFILQKLNHSNVFITGGGGVGKSYITKAVVENYKSLHKNVVVLGSTGISAVEVGGITLHSFFGFGICKNYDELKDYDRSRKDKLRELQKILKNCDLIVIDEISTVSADVFDMIYLRLLNSSFNGRLLVVGDFYQLPPIIKNEEKTKNLFTNSIYAFSSASWEAMKFIYIEMVGSKRTNDAILYDILSKLRIGIVDENVVKILNSLCVSSEILNENNDFTALFGVNSAVNALNSRQLAKLNTKLYRSLGVCEIIDDKISRDKVQSWIKNLNCNDVLELKTGSKVIFTTNKKDEFYNGEQGVVREIKVKDEIVSSIIVEKANGDFIEVLPQIFEMSDFYLQDGEINQNLLATYSQIPLKLAYAITIHKSQGMSIKNLICDINRIFVGGQLYVALSRAVTLENLRIIYSKNENLESYLKRSVQIDPMIQEFYNNDSFETIKNQELNT